MADEYDMSGRTGKQCRERYIYFNIIDITTIWIPQSCAQTGLSSRKNICMHYTMRSEINGRSLLRSCQAGTAYLNIEPTTASKITFTQKCAKPSESSTRSSINISKKASKSSSYQWSIKLWKLQMRSLNRPCPINSWSKNAAVKIVIFRHQS